MRKTYFVTGLAGPYVAGHRVEIMEPGSSGVVELSLTERQAEHELRIGSLSEEPPAKPEPEGEAEEAGPGDGEPATDPEPAGAALASPETAVDTSDAPTLAPKRASRPTAA